MRTRHLLTGKRLQDAEAAALEMLQLVRGIVLRELRSGVLPLTPALAGELDAYARQIAAVMPPKPVRRNAPTLRLLRS